MNEDKFTDIYSTAIKALDGLDVNKELIIDKVDQILIIFGFSREEYPLYDNLIKKITNYYDVKIDQKPKFLVDTDDHQDWYENSVERPMWETFKQLLIDDKGFEREVVNSIDNTTDTLMELIENPKRVGVWDRRGAVIGSIQSGKTTNYCALINKAIDAGYKIIVVMSGQTNDLRMQTQGRLDESVIGIETTFSKTESIDKKNLSKLGKTREQWKMDNKNINISQPQPLTFNTMDGDLGPKNQQGVEIQKLLGNKNDPIVFCIKKNKTPLTNLIKLLIQDSSSHKLLDKKTLKIDNYLGQPIVTEPILVIDDEADQSSVDTGVQSINDDNDLDPEYNPKTINKLIRTILNINARSIYIGYTATPFANIFISPEAKTNKEGEDLFPRSFIYALPVPSNYYGIENMQDYSLDSEEIQSIPENFKPIYDFEDEIPLKHKSTYIVTKLPKSLKEALKYFIISCFIRNIEIKTNDHRSMLIHVSRFINVNKQIYELVFNEIDIIRATLKSTERTIMSKLYNEFSAIYLDLKKEKVDDYFWDQNHDQLNVILKDIESNIKNLSGSSTDVIDYKLYKQLKEKGISSIIIGGDKLSRGLTLEGLTISYFLRHAKAYDTLSQMGRWFGYKDDYIDSCRIFTSIDIIDNFVFLSDATIDLKNEFDLMTQNKSNPKEFGLKIKSHPHLIATSRLKMRTAEKIQVNFNGTGGQTTTFNKKDFDQNIAAVNKLIAGIGDPKDNSGRIRKHREKVRGFMWEKINSIYIRDFLIKYKAHSDSRTVHPKEWATYINKKNDFGELNNWTVVLIGAGSSKRKYSINGKYEVELLERKPSFDDINNKVTIRVLTSPKDETYDLDDHSIDEIMNSNFEQGINNIKFRDLRHPSSGLLVLYPLYRFNSSEEYADYKENKPDQLIEVDNSLVNFGIMASFPGKGKILDDYWVNTTYTNNT